MKTQNEISDSPHQDISGESRRIVLATCLAGKDSLEVVMHMTPAEVREYNCVMAIPAQISINLAL